MAGKSSDEQRKRKIVMLLFLHSFFGRGLQFASCEERSPASEQCFLVVRAGEGHLKTRRIWFITLSCVLCGPNPARKAPIILIDVTPRAKIYIQSSLVYTPTIHKKKPKRRRRALRALFSAYLFSYVGLFLVNKSKKASKCRRSVCLQHVIIDNRQKFT